MSALGQERADGIYQFRRGYDWENWQVCRYPTFSLLALESFRASNDIVRYIRHEDYVKFSFWLSGRHTTVLDGCGQHDHDRPEVFITTGPPEMIKADLLNRATQVSVVALCVRREFFSQCLGIAATDLPSPLRALFVPEEAPYAFHRLPLSADLGAAARAILAAPCVVRGNPLYAQAKSVELMCLLINLLTAQERRMQECGRRLRGANEARLLKARDLITQRYAAEMTLEQIAAEVGLNRMALTSGFKQLFNMSVYDFVQKQRMENAYELLRDHANSVNLVAKAVGFKHACSFSTAFRAHFGCTPQQSRDHR